MISIGFIVFLWLCTIYCNWKMPPFSNSSSFLHRYVEHLKVMQIHYYSLRCWRKLTNSMICPLEDDVGGWIGGTV